MRSGTWLGLGLCAALLGCGGDDGGGLLDGFAGSGGSAALAAGSSGAGSGGQAAAGSAGSEQAGSGGTAASDKLKMSIIARAVPVGGQEHVCVVVELPNAEPIWVDRIEAVLSGGSHHLIVDRK